MDFQEQFVQVLYNLIPVLEFASGHLNQLMTEEVHKLKGIGIAQLGLEMKFGLGPFERAEDRLYRDHGYLKAVHLKIKMIRERIAGIEDKERSRGKEIGHQDISNRKTLKGNSQQEKQKVRFDGGQTKRMSSTAPEGSQVTDVLQQMTDIRNEIKKFKTLSDLLTDLKAEVHKMETALSVEAFEKLVTLLEKTFSPNLNKLLINGNIFNGINNVTYNNQYQIENVFAINRLSEGKEADAQIIGELTAHKPNEALQKAVNNLKPAGEQLSLQHNDLELLAQLQKNFSRVFAHQNVSLDQMNQMSKIIDFVERYHGEVARLSDSAKQKKGDGTKGRRGWKQNLEGKVLCEGGLDVFGGSEEEKKPISRRKGSVKQ